METYRLQDAVSRGLGRAALRLGESYDAYRPTDPFAPITPRSFFLRLDAAFHGEDQSWHRSARYGVPVWFGVYDSAYIVASGEISDEGQAHGSLGQLRIIYDAHVHPNVQAGPDLTGLATPQA
jgi:hypothetical protein